MSREPRPDDLARAAAGDPPELPSTLVTATGTVKFWRADKGYGAIACPRIAPWDIWCHFSALQMTGFKSLVPGERVTVEFRRGNQESFRFVAYRVWRLDSEGSQAEPAPDVC
jgi:CspA family cold shock protein